MSGSSNNHGHQACTCKIATPSVSQTLDELDFSRGIWTAALDGDKEELLNCLQRKNVHPDSQDSSGYTALHYAARNGHLNICRVLLEHRASPNIQTNSGRVTPLHRAAYSGHTAIVELLIKHGADVTFKDSDGKIPLHKAAENGHKAVVERLLGAYHDGKTVTDNRGRKPVDCVPIHCDKIVNLLTTDRNQSDKLDVG